LPWQHAIIFLVPEEEQQKEELTKDKILEILKEKGHLDDLAGQILESARQKGITDPDEFRKRLPVAPGLVIPPFQGGS